ncbi:efflux RND transporter periplasmic adaptor subunit [Shewanella electrodiphila]|uniref:Efflux RND transporter periplasmic adaptor subunit n=1 Tax=Shewanella electrodiphila TaxID=934143 RepID=A0ABT0KTS0_9GAMM|nr:efflux RND transporter periplasmic adaptor subunit [Shewanella electrodiphila]MCL1047179.1 efflux RND transporter periplasmic adaptor subunit [Shewanella electrodiphila]
MIKTAVFLYLCLFSTYSFASNYIVGKLIPEKSVIIRSEVSGVVDSFQVDSGDPVSLNTPLLSISHIDYGLNVDLARYNIDVKRSELEAQENQLKRYQSLLKSKGISEGTFENQLRLTNISRAEHNMSKTEYEISQRTLAKAAPQAPFDGVVTQRSIEVGQFISVGDSLYSIADFSKLKVSFHLLESDFDQFVKGDSVKVTIPSIPLQVTGKISLFSPVMQENAPGFAVEVTLENADNQLHPSMEVYVHFNEESPQ